MAKCCNNCVSGLVDFTNKTYEKLANLSGFVKVGDAFKKIHINPSDRTCVKVAKVFAFLLATVALAPVALLCGVASAVWDFCCCFGSNPNSEENAPETVRPAVPGDSGEGGGGGACSPNAYAAPRHRVFG